LMQLFLLPLERLHSPTSKVFDKYCRQASDTMCMDTAKCP
jgi:hypothetical protein